MPSSRILGTGCYVPPRVVTNFDIMKMMETTDEFIVERTGVRRRRHAEPDVAASDLGALACRAAVADAGLAMDQIDLVIMNTITPDHADPGCAFFLQAKLGLAGIPVLDIKQQCAGLIYGLSLADHFVRAGTYRHVLVACAEVLSTRIDGSYDGRNIAILLGDGAGAVVVGPAADGRSADLIAPRSTLTDSTRRRCIRLPPAVAWAARNTSRRRTSTPAECISAWTARPSFRTAWRRCPQPCSSAWRPTDCRSTRSTASCPIRPICGCWRRLSIASALRGRKSIVNVEDYGNIGSASLPIALHEARQAGMVRPGSLTLLVAFGSGFVWGSALLRT